MPPLRRHQLAYLQEPAWQDVLTQAWDEQARDCLQHWSRNGLPLVVTRQPAPLQRDGQVMLGLPAPAAWGRRALSLQLPLSQLGWLDEFPEVSRVLPLLPARARRAVQALAARLAADGLRARAYGSFGWQCVNRLQYVHARSDLDLWLAVEDEAQADLAATHLQAAGTGGLRIDGELMFPDGAAVAWREWAAWRGGRAGGVLVKRLCSVGVEREPRAFAMSREPAECMA